MDLEAAPRPTRRRGRELETAILDAGWAVLQESGYEGFSFDAVAARAGTSRPVLYRRWPARADLMLATIQHAGVLAKIQMPDTGSVRDDALEMLRRVNKARSGYSALLSALLGEYFRETGRTYRDLRSIVNPGERNGFQTIVDRAVERGEFPTEPLPTRVIDVAIDLFRLEMLMTMKEVPDDHLVAMIDEIWLPLLRTYGAKV